MLQCVALKHTPVACRPGTHKYLNDLAAWLGLYDPWLACLSVGSLLQVVLGYAIPLTVQYRLEQKQRNHFLRQRQRADDMYTRYLLPVQSALALLVTNVTSRPQGCNDWLHMVTQLLSAMGVCLC